MRRRLVPYVLAAHAAASSPLAVAVAQATANDNPAKPTEPTESAQPAKPAEPTAGASLVRVDHVKAPRRVVLHRRVRPWRHPTPRQVRMLIRAEAHRWHIPVSSLSRRVACESRYRWSATNGQYVGVLQFGANAFYRGLRTIRDRRIRLVVRRDRTVHDARILHYADGRIARKRGRRRRQQVVYVYEGRLPRHPPITDTWTQLRIGAQAIRGISAVHSSEWSCPA